MLIIMAVFLTVAVIFLAFVVDLGNQRQDRRQLTTATDASALDVGQEWADSQLLATHFGPVVGGVSDCSSAAQDYLERNRAESPDGYSCEARWVNGQFASVSIFANGSVDYQIAPAIGINEGLTNSTTSVRIRSAPGGGLRPFAVCANDSVELNAWINNPVTPIDIIVGGPKFLSTGCGQNNGNWGMLQFPTQAEGVGNTNGGGLAGTMAQGTEDDTISLSESVSKDADVECNKTYEIQSDENGVSCLFQVTGNPWTNNGLLDALQYVKDEAIIFNFPVYEDVVDLGGSGNGFPILAFLEVRVLSFCGDDTPTVKAVAQLALGACSGGNDNFMHLQLLRVATGQCCNVNAFNRVLEICDVGTTGGALDSTFTQNCQTASGSSGPPPSVPPPPDPCNVETVAPTPQTVAVGNGQTGSLAERSYTVDVVDETDCTGLTVVATTSGPGVDATVSPGPGANQFTATFPAGTQFQKNKSYVIEVRHGSETRDSSAILLTTAAP